jgi:hypothetical protein
MGSALFTLVIERDYGEPCHEIRRVEDDLSLPDTTTKIAGASLAP